MLLVSHSFDCYAADVLVSSHTVDIAVNPYIITIHNVTNNVVPITINFRNFLVNPALTVPDNADSMQFTFTGVIQGRRDSGSYGYTIGSIMFNYNDGQFYYGYQERASDIWAFRGTVDVTPGTEVTIQRFSMTIYVMFNSSNPQSSDTFSLILNTHIPDAEHNISFFTRGDDRSVRASDIKQQTSDLTSGYDSSTGDQLSSAANTAVDDYIKQEDQLYDQMSYEVPDIDVGSDTSAILLSSNFLQSLYSSNSFISRCVTFVLTFGLLLYIVGWLKKKSG